jgi:hypothetical protein
MTAIAKAQTAVEQIQSADDPAWLYWVNRAHFLHCSGWSMAKVTHTERAVPLLAEAAQLLSDGYQRDQQYTLILLAETLVAPGEQQDLEAAAHHGIEAIQIAETLLSGGSTKRIQELAQQMAPHANLPAVKDFMERARGVVAG